ncbi:hypothetical protein, partial [Burkholderia gladioli]|uniref:hypothetical protein n=1 Tax=Burkholderia gladioli TaxID=28095 RepID=UPI001ABA48DD
VASAQRPEILLAARVSPTGKFSNLSVTACPVMQGQVHRNCSNRLLDFWRSGVQSSSNWSWNYRFDQLRYG